MAFDENVPLAANQIAADLVAVNANWEHLKGAIKGGTTSGRNLRTIALTIDDATEASKLKCTVENKFNGDTIAVTDNIVKDATTGNFTLSADGSNLTIEAAGLTSSVVAVISISVYNNNSNTALDVYGAGVMSDISTIYYGAGDGDAKDLTTLVDTGALCVLITYITDE